jgi:hypothetical protein
MNLVCGKKLSKKICSTITFPLKESVPKKKIFVFCLFSLFLNHSNYLFLELQCPRNRNLIILISSDRLKIETLLLLAGGRYLQSVLQESYRKSSGEDKADFL